MRNIHRVFAGTVIVAALLGATAASAQDARVTVFPPLYRDLARTTQAVQPHADLKTTPQPVHVSPGAIEAAARKKVADVR